MRWVAGVDAPLHAVLLHKDEGAEENAFDGYDHGQEDEGIRVEAPHEGDYAGVDQEPQGEDDGVDGDEPQASTEAAYQVRDDVGDRAVTLKAALQFGYGANVGGYGAGGLFVCHGCIDALVGFELRPIKHCLAEPHPAKPSLPLLAQK